jgi:thiosulfate/3-mercaptopyruvate sulfurtransferase
MVSASEFAALLARLGISEGTCAVIYDDGSGAIAARLWFQLRLHGHQRAQLLDGGLAAWTAAGYPLDSAAPQPSPAPARPLVRDESLLVDRATIAAWVAQRGSSAAAPLLLDARAPERYRGEVEPIDPVAGHIPGAINLPFARLLRGPADPRWRPAEEVRALLLQHTGASEESLRARGVIASCGSGVTACHLLAALALAGLPPGKLYGGSYSDWVSEANAEVARGSEPG